MDPREMDEKARESWEVRMSEILRSRTTWPRVMDGGVLVAVVAVVVLRLVVVAVVGMVATVLLDLVLGHEILYTLSDV
jgi:hypothetical protein